MPRGRGHFHARQRDEGGNGAVGDYFITQAIEKRGIVTVYTTVTSSGWTGGDLTTIYPSSTSQGAGDSDSKTTPSGTLEKDHKTIAKQAAQTSTSTSTTLPPAIEASTAQTSMGTGALVAATVVSSTSSTTASSASSSTSATSTTATAASATSSASSSSGSSGSDDVATKAGIALGVLGGILLALAFVYFMLMRRRKQLEAQQQRAADDEKLNGPFEDGPAPATPAKPPRLSLRPMTGLFTSFSASTTGEQRAKSPGIAMAAAGPMTRRAPGGSAWDRPMTSESQSNHDPFGSSAETLPEEPDTPKNPMSPLTPISEASMPLSSPQHPAGLSPAPRAVSVLTTDTAHAPRVSAVTMDSATVPPLMTSHLPISPAGSTEVSPIESADNIPVGQAISSPEPTPAAAFNSHPIASGAAYGASLSVMQRQPSERRQSVRKENVPAPLDLTLPPKLGAVPPSPAGTEFSLHEVEPDQSPIPSSGAAAIAAAGGPANSTVHRVQLDFKPTLDDEMELQAGQVVRLLHEYDDGWALCIRLDRSQQGVVPRTCLSTRPVKPRMPQGGPRGPPANPQGRSRGPSVSSQRGPGGQPHPLGPAGPRGPGFVRPIGPPVSGGRSMGPGPRPQSPNGPGRKPSPPGPSNMQQEYRPSLDSQSQRSAARKPVPGQAY